MDVRLDSDLFISFTHFSGKLSFSHKIWWEDPGKAKKTKPWELSFLNSKCK